MDVYDPKVPEGTNQSAVDNTAIKSSYYQQRANAILQTAEKALSQLPAVEVEVAKTARLQLYWWLSQISRIGQDPSVVLDLLGVRDQFLVYLREENLSEDQAWFAFLKMFSVMFRRAHVVSRGADHTFFEPTGFSADASEKTIYCKVGRAQYQPIAFDDGEHLVNTEGAKLLYLRDWAIACELAWMAPFRVTETTQTIEVGLTTRDIECIKEAITWFAEDCAIYSGYTSVQEDEKKALEYKMRQGISLACIRLPFLNDHLAALTARNPEIGTDCAGLEITQACTCISEFLRLSLDNDTVLKTVTNRVLHVDERTSLERKILVQIVDDLSKGLKFIEQPYGTAMLEQHVLNARFIYPDLAPLILNQVVSEAARIVLDYAKLKLSQI